jgi:hypothetical protein
MSHKDIVETSLIVCGLSAASYMKFGQLSPDSLVVAMSPKFDDAPGAEPDRCIDLTACVRKDAAVALERYAARVNLVLVRDHQLESDQLADLIRHHNLSVIVLNTEIDYDTDVSWTISRLEWAATRVAVKWFALDIFCGVEGSWNTLLTARDDEFTTTELEQICQRFPVVLSADTTLSNCFNIFSFPGAQGLLLTCNENSPILPPERHSMTADDAYNILTALLGHAPR